MVAVAASDHHSYSLAIPINTVRKLLTQTQRIEPLVEWQENPQIHTYTCLVQSQTKFLEAQKQHSTTLYEEAVIYLDKAIQLNPGSSLSYYKRGTVKSQLGLLKIDEDDLTEGQKHYRDAIIDYTKAIKLCLDYDSAYNNRAYAKFHFGKSEEESGNVEAAQHLYQEGIIDINIAIDLNLSDALFYHTRGEIMYALGDFCAALDNYEKAREIDPTYINVCKDLELAKEALKQQRAK